MLLAHDAPTITMQLQEVAPTTRDVVRGLRDSLYGVSVSVDERAREACFTFSSARSPIEARARLNAVLSTRPGWTDHLRFSPH